MLQYLHMKNNQTISLPLSPTQINKLKKTYHASLKPSNNPYMDALIQIDGCTISVYTSQKVVFQGPQALEMAQLFGYQPQVFEPHIGSDEVGTGDYFGPVCVCAAYVDDTHQSLIDSLAIKDSKLLNDQQVIELADQLRHVIPHSLLVLSNRQYNLVHETTNLNAIKAKLHNQAIAHLLKKITTRPTIIVDQFTPELNYYRYLSDEQHVIDGITFTTKAESKYVGVAIGAILARAAFIEAFKQLESQLNMHLPKGASDAVDEAAVNIVKSYGWPMLDKVAKMHFKNTKKVQEKIKTDE
jgi:ribonuclease HIII